MGKLNENRCANTNEPFWANPCGGLRENVRETIVSFYPGTSDHHRTCFSTLILQGAPWGVPRGAPRGVPWGVLRGVSLRSNPRMNEHFLSLILVLPHQMMGTSYSRSCIFSVFPLLCNAFLICWKPSPNKISFCSSYFVGRPSWDGFR